MASGRVEQDGFIVLDLELPETEGDVALEIPIRALYATLFHACGTGCRMNPAGFLPKGEGRIFGSREVTHAVDNVLPYVWIGTDTCGICYAIDTDCGWEHAKARDATEIFREADGTVVLRLNLLNGAGRHAARTITVTLQASPTKPMPKRWRGWVDAYDVPAERNTLCNCSNPTWGCYIVGMARYPTYEDWGYVRKMREAADTGKVDEAWTEAWIARCWKDRREHPELVPWLAKKPDDAGCMKTLRAHAFAGMRRPLFLSRHPNRVLYYYTCNADPCDGLYELDVMKDEWGRFASVYGSHADYALYYLKRMCEEGMTGVYNDNTFFRLNYDWVAGNAWIDGKGNVHPSFQLFANRAYCRRQIQAMLEAGVKDPWLTMHHTNANILPVLSFATNTMGMEWKYGADDYQDRWSPDYVRAVNQGYQGGFFATSLEGLFNLKPEERTRVTRTMLAVLLPHEVQPTLQASGDHALVKKVLGLKQAFGVAEDDCAYTAYWSGENPIRQRDDVLVSVYRRGDRLLAVVGSYAKTDIDLELRLKGGRVLAAKDAETGAALKIADGVAVLPLKRHDFALVEMTIRQVSGEISAYATAACEAYVRQARKAYATEAFADYRTSLVTQWVAWVDGVGAQYSQPAAGTVRWIHVDGTANFRDIGGWTGLRTGLVYRGAEPNCHTNRTDRPGRRGAHDLYATAAGLKTLSEDLGIRTDLDLRGAAESPTPDETPIPGARLVRIPLSAYTGCLTTGKARLAEALRLFADRKNYPIYFHCYGGADRTGTLALVLEGLCGVSEADLSVDFELTSFGLGCRPRYDFGYSFASTVAELKKRPGATLADKIAAFAKADLGLTDAEIASIRAILLLPSH